MCESKGIVGEKGMICFGIIGGGSLGSSATIAVGEVYREGGGGSLVVRYTEGWREHLGGSTHVFSHVMKRDTNVFITLRSGTRKVFTSHLDSV